MACLGLKPGATGWKAQTNPLSYGVQLLKFNSNHLLPTLNSSALLYLLYVGPLQSPTLHVEVI